MNELPEKEVVIRPPSGLGKFDPAEYYRYRHMLISLVKRDSKSQFDEMHLGVVWAVVRPLTVALVFTFFKHASGANTHVSSPYLMFVYSGLMLWYYFADATIQTAGSVKKDASIIGKIYFPRLIIPLVPILSNLIGLGIATIPLLLMMAWYQILPGWNVLFLPIVILQCMVLVFGIGALFAALTINNRDLEQFLSFAMYIGIFLSPVFFVPEMLPSWAKNFFLLNPMTGTLLAFRACLFDADSFPVFSWAYSSVFSIVLAVIGSAAFRRAEATFVDRL